MIKFEPAPPPPPVERDIDVTVTVTLKESELREWARGSKLIYNLKKAFDARLSSAATVETYSLLEQL